MKILITGTTGFIGKNLLKTICENFSVLAINTSEPKLVETKYKIKYIKSSLKDIGKYENIISKFKPKVAIHLAWYGIPDLGQKNSEINEKNSIKLIDILVKQKSLKKIIITGSCLEYGSSKINCKENQFVIPNSYFSNSKNNIRKYLQEKCDKNQINYLWLRLFYVYGEYQRENSLIPSLINSLLKKEVPENDYINIHDVVSFIKLGIKNKMDNGIYNVGSGKTFTPIHISRIIEEKLYGNDNLTKKIELNKTYNTKIRFSANIMKFSEYYDTNNLITLDKGIEKLIKN